MSATDELLGFLNRYCEVTGPGDGLCHDVTARFCGFVARIDLLRDWDKIVAHAHTIICAAELENSIRRGDYVPISEAAGVFKEFKPKDVIALPPIDRVIDGMAESLFMKAMNRKYLRPLPLEDGFEDLYKENNDASTRN